MGVLAPADVAIVGGGILGLAIAWRLAEREPAARVVVLERGALASGATAQAAALLTRARACSATAALVRETYRAIGALEERLEMSLDLRRTGMLHVTGTVAGVAGLDALDTGDDPVERLDGAAAAARVPWLAADAVHTVLFLPDDGFLDPARLALAYGAAARRAGAEVRTGVAVHGVRVECGRAIGLDTADGFLPAGRVVLAAGAWTLALAAAAGIGLPAAPVRSEYWFTTPSPLFPREQPAVVLTDIGAYTRPELGALLIGLRSGVSPTVDARTLPDDAGGLDLGGDGTATLAEQGERLARFLPALGEVGIARYVAGLSTYTPDRRFLIGAASGLEDLFVATGCGGAGIATSGGVARLTAALVLGEEPPFDPAPFDPGRFGGVDPFDPAFRARCGAARSGKTAG